MVYTKPVNCITVHKTSSQCECTENHAHTHTHQSRAATHSISLKFGKLGLLSAWRFYNTDVINDITNTFHTVGIDSFSMYGSRHSPSDGNSQNKRRDRDSKLFVYLHIPYQEMIFDQCKSAKIV